MGHEAANLEQVCLNRSTASTKLHELAHDLDEETPCQLTLCQCHALCLLLLLLHLLPRNQQEVSDLRSTPPWSQQWTVFGRVEELWYLAPELLELLCQDLVQALVILERRLFHVDLLTNQLELLSQLTVRVRHVLLSRNHVKDLLVLRHHLLLHRLVVLFLQIHPLCLYSLLPRPYLSLLFLLQLIRLVFLQQSQLFHRHHLHLQILLLKNRFYLLCFAYVVFLKNKRSTMLRSDRLAHVSLLCVCVCVFACVFSAHGRYLLTEPTIEHALFTHQPSTFTHT